MSETRDIRRIALLMAIAECFGGLHMMLPRATSKLHGRVGDKIALTLDDRYYTYSCHKTNSVRGATSVLPPANEDLLRRRWVWQALSDLFLDDEITDDTLRYAARISAECDYSDEELDAIFRNEVAPALAFNYFDVAGVWGYFDSAWLQERILTNRGFGYWFDRLIVAPIPLWLLRNYWTQFKGMLKEERARVRDSRERVDGQWTPCCHEDAPVFRWENAK